MDQAPKDTGKVRIPDAEKLSGSIRPFAANLTRMPAKVRYAPRLGAPIFHFVLIVLFVGAGLDHLLQDIHAKTGMFDLQQATRQIIAFAVAALAGGFYLRLAAFRPELRVIAVFGPHAVRVSDATGRAWQAPYSEFLGVSVRKFAVRGAEAGRQIYHAIELLHEDPSKTLPLYVKSGRWKGDYEFKSYSQKLDVSAIDHSTPARWTGLEQLDVDLSKRPVKVVLSRSWGSFLWQLLLPGVAVAYLTISAINWLQDTGEIKWPAVISVPVVIAFFGIPAFLGLAFKRIAFFGDKEVRIKERGGNTWTASYSEFLGVRHRRFTDREVTTSDPLYHIIELAHPDEEKSLPLYIERLRWTGEARLADYARQLNLPVLEDETERTS